MSKSKGNAVDPMEALGKFGADAIRWYFYTNSSPWLPNRFHDKAVTEGQRKFLGTLWNTYAFFVLYANIDGFSAQDYKLEYDKLPVMDRWLLSKLNSMLDNGGLNRRPGTYSFTYSPVIHVDGGGDVRQVRDAVEDSYSEFCSMMDQWVRDNDRRKF